MEQNQGYGEPRADDERADPTPPIRLLSLRHGARPAPPLGWAARCLSAQSADEPVWVLWRVAAVCIAVVSDAQDAPGLAGDLRQAGYRRVGVCPSGVVWVRPASAGRSR